MKTLLLIGLGAWFVCDIAYATETNEPQTLVELNRWYEEPPVGQNAAPLYLMGFIALHFNEADEASADLPLIGTAKLPDGDEVLPTKMKAAIVEFIDNNRGALRFFIEAAKYEQSRYPIDLNQGQATMLPHGLKM